MATEILQAGPPKLQAKMFSKFIRVAQRLLERRNYATCAQILSGVSNQAVQRLKKLSKQLDWKTVELYESLNDTFDPVSGYSHYRNQLSHEAPSLPFIAVHLRTLTLIEEGNPVTLGDDAQVLSFARMVMYAEDIARLRLADPAMTRYEPALVRNAEIQAQLSALKPLDDEQLYQLSSDIEPVRSRPAPVAQDPQPDDDDDE